MAPGVSVGIQITGCRGRFGLGKSVHEFMKLLFSRHACTLSHSVPRGVDLRIADGPPNPATRPQELLLQRHLVDDAVLVIARLNRLIPL